MARSRTLEDQQHEQATMPHVDDTGFGAEFRELARQRRFVRSSGDPDPSGRESTFWATNEAPAPPSTPAVVEPAPPSASPTSTPTPVVPTPAVPAPVVPAPEPAATSVPARPRVRTPRMSEDQRATLMELARMSDRLVESREALVTATSRVEQLETELGSARDGLTAANDRLMASRVIVMDAQRTTRELAERSAWLEGRVEMLQEALELAVNASAMTRWKWRRAQRARLRDRP